MSLKPPLKCPPDYSILVFRLSECKKASVVKGVTTLSSLDLEPLAIPIQEHSEGTLILKAGAEKLLDISENDIGHVNFKYLQPIFRDNIEIESLNLADCKINGE